MIVVKLMGGLGNQMFQYAAARALALRHGTGLRLDRSFLAQDPGGKWTPREYELDVFHLAEENAARAEARLLQWLHDSRFLRKITSKQHGRLPLCHFTERHAGFDPRVKSCPSSTYLYGYFQSEKYFLDCAGTIRKDFHFVPEPQGRNAELLSEIVAEPLAVSVHVRRGDYVTLAAAGAFHGTMETAYYEEGAQYILNRVSGIPSFYVFSDDPAWARGNLRLPGRMTVIDWNSGKSGFEDMRLMSRCRHHIIANSSFSWWGAWLNPSADKIVIAPEVWFRGSAQQPVDLIPESWIQL
jgi:hypothetical protein